MVMVEVVEWIRIGHCGSGVMSHCGVVHVSGLYIGHFNVLTFCHNRNKVNEWNTKC